MNRGERSGGRRKSAAPQKPERRILFLFAGKPVGLLSHSEARSDSFWSGVLEANQRLPCLCLLRGQSCRRVALKWSAKRIGRGRGVEAFPKRAPAGHRSDCGKMIQPLIHTSPPTPLLVLPSLLLILPPPFVCGYERAEPFIRQSFGRRRAERCGTWVGLNWRGRSASQTFT